MLQSGPRHGYEIKKGVEQALGGIIALNNKTLYLALKRFEELGAVTRQVVPQEGKPPRHLYKLTEQGSELLHAYLLDFGPEQAGAAGADAEFFTRVAFFDLLSVEERATILRVRLAHLEKNLAYLQNMQQLANTDTSEACANIIPSMTYAQRVLGFQTQRIGNEYRWIADWLTEETRETPDRSM